MRRPVHTVKATVMSAHPGLKERGREGGRKGGREGEGRREGGSIDVCTSSLGYNALCQ